MYHFLKLYIFFYKKKRGPVLKIVVIIHLNFNKNINLIIQDKVLNS